MTYGVAPNAVALNSDGFVLAAPSHQATGASNVTISELELSIIPIATVENSPIMHPNAVGIYDVLIETYPFGAVFAINMPKGIETFDSYDITLAVVNENGNQELTFIKDSTGAYGIGVDGSIVSPMSVTTENTLQFVMSTLPFGEFKMQAKHKLKGFTMEIKVDLQWDESVDLVSCSRVEYGGEPNIGGEQTAMNFTLYPKNAIGSPINGRGADMTVTYSNPEHLSTPLEYDPLTQGVTLNFIEDRNEDLRGTLTVTMDNVVMNVDVIARASYRVGVPYGVIWSDKTIVNEYEANLRLLFRIVDEALVDAIYDLQDIGINISNYDGMASAGGYDLQERWIDLEYNPVRDIIYDTIVSITYKGRVIGSVNVRAMPRSPEV